MTIFHMENGWRDLCTEGPCDLYTKGNWDVWKSARMTQWRVDYCDEKVTNFDSFDQARRFIDEQYAAGKC